jgi:hypothetical protein
VIAWRAGVVRGVRASWPGAVELDVEVDAAVHASSRGAVGGTLRALAYPDQVGPTPVGARVLLNVSAQARGLGTGGFALVVARTDALPADPPPGPGHLVKARYTPLQVMVLGVDDQESEHHDLLADADDLAGMPVVVADLHSALPAVLAGARWEAARLGRPAPRVAYVMTDGGALPAAFSRTVAALRAAGWLASCVTVGQAFGGDLEAVTVHTGLLAARLVVGADLVVVAQGPGNLGTGTRWGFSGVASGDAVNAVGALRGRAVAALRVSGADARERHLGVSHHSLTAYGRVALAPADVVVPRLGGDLAGLGDRVAQQAAALARVPAGHRLVEVDAGDELLAALRDTPVRLSSMGRGLDDDPAAFLAPAAAGVHAARLVAG